MTSEAEEQTVEKEWCTGVQGGEPGTTFQLYILQNFLWHKTRFPLT